MSLILAVDVGSGLILLARRMKKMSEDGTSKRFELEPVYGVREAAAREPIRSGVANTTGSKHLLKEEV